MLAVERLGKRYGSRWLFRNLEFEVLKGQALVVLGRNGSGKSTLIRMLAGLVRPSEGVVHLPDGDARRTLGLSAIEMALYPSLTVEEHMRLAGDLRGCAARTEELLEQVALGYASAQPISELSTGMKARLKLALAIQAKPALLLLDEPGSGLDEQGLKTLGEVVQEQLARGALVVATNDPAERRFATHELELAG